MKGKLIIAFFALLLSGCSDSLVNPDVPRSPHFGDLAQIDSVDGLSLDSDWLRGDEQ